MGERESRILTKILRHRLKELKKAGIEVDNEGYVPLTKLLTLTSNIISIKEKGLLAVLTLEQVQTIVRDNDKQRLKLVCRKREMKDEEEKEDENVWLIRANQGHGADSGAFINDELSMTRITEPVDGTFHGTYIQFKESIARTGLNKGKRKHIHIAKTSTAKSGQRNNCTLMVDINMRLAMDDGVVFYESDNGVILTEGIANSGILPAKYLSFRVVAPLPQPPRTTSIGACVSADTGTGMKIGGGIATTTIGPASSARVTASATATAEKKEKK